jgi:alkylation response protein AidB-like acyl-CoA dehydrogenase
MGPDPQQCFDEIVARGAGDDPLTRQDAARLRGETKVIDLLHEKVVEAMMAGDDPGPVASIRKALADVHGQDLMTMVKDLSGPEGMIGQQDEEAEEEDPWHWGYLFSRALTIGGGTSEVQRNIIGERLLGLPREPSPDSSKG